MPHHHERRRLPYPPEQIYDLVADIRRYPEFLPWVAAMRVRKDSETEALADMIVGFKALRESFSSRVVKTPKSAICVDYLDGPLKHLRNRWRFEPDGEGCVIDFEVDFAFKNRVFQALAGQFFETALRKMIGAFEARAHDLYGGGADSSPASRPGAGEPGSSSSSAQTTA